MFWLLGIFALAARPRVAVVVSDTLDPYEEPVSAFTESLGEPVTVINLNGLQAEADAAVKKLRREPVKVLFCLGAKAAYAMKQAFPYTPVVYAAVRDPARYGIEGRQITGVSSQISPITYLSQVQSFFPQVMRVGVLRRPDDDAASLIELETAAAEVGMSLVTIPVESPRKIRRALATASDQIDALWVRPDRVLLTRDSFRAVTDETRRRRMPLLVDTDNMVRAGGLFAVVPSTRGVGQQAADVVTNLLDGAAPAVIPVQEPIEVDVALNLRTLELSEIPFDELLLDFVDEVVE